jgi:hypothetical protein
MAGEKAVNKDAKEELPPHEAGREVLNYVQQQEKEADDAFNEAHGIDPEEEKKPAGAEKEEKAAEAEPGKEEKKPEGKEPETKEPEKKEAAAEVEDLAKGLNTDNASARISAAQNKMHDSNKRANTAEGEATRLQEEKEVLLKKLEEKTIETPAKAEAEAGKEEKKVEAASDDELQASLTELEQEYPEIAKPMLKMMARQNAENKKLEEKVEALTVKDKARDDEIKSTKENAHYIAIAEVHADFDEISKEPLLDEWIDGLPAIEKAGAQAIRKNGSTENVIKLLTSFKQANGYELPAKEEKEETPAKKSNSKIEKAKSAGNPSFNKSKDVNLKAGEVLFTRQQIDNMTQEEYNENEPAIDEAMSKGLIR